MTPAFKTSDLDAASFLVARGFSLLGIERGRRSTFLFDVNAAAAVSEFYSGGMVCAQDFGSALRQLKAEIHSNPTTTNTTEGSHDRRF